MSHNFHIGQQVQCIYSGPWLHIATYELATAPMPQKDGVYRIRGFQAYANTRWVGLFLEEFPDPLNFCSDVFRPLTERKTNIEALTALLNPANHKPLVEFVDEPRVKKREPV